MTDIQMSDEVAAGIKDRFNNLSNEFANEKVFIASEAGKISSGCGEFSGSVANGVAVFELGWRDLMDVGTTGAGLIAGNTNALHVDLTAMDQDLSWSISI